MRFLIYGTTDSAPPAPPTQQMMEDVAKLTEDTRRAGILLATGGLGPVGAKIQSTGGKLAVTDGPFTETKELTGGFALIEVKSREEAIEWAKRFRRIVGDGESAIQEVFGG